MKKHLFLSGILIFFAAISFARQVDTTLYSISDFPNKFLGALDQKTSNLDKLLTIQTAKYLQRLRKKENKLKNKLYKLDSNATKNLFLLNTDSQYVYYLQKIKSNSVYDPKKVTGEYLPYADSIQGALSFLKQNPQLIGSTKILPAEIKESLAKFQQLQSKIQDAEQIKQYIRERKEQIKEYLLQFAHLPAGIKNIYADYNKELYYYSAQLREYKDALNDPDKLFEKALSILEKMPFFQTFLKNNSILSSLYPNSGSFGSPQAIAGLQTRNQLSQMIGSQLSAPGAQEAFSNNLSDAQSQLDQVKDKLMKYGQGGPDVDIPNFKPNAEKVKSFFSRLEYGTNVQTQSGSYFFPITTDLGMSVGYKLDSKGNIIGLGGSYKIGWGKDINHIDVSGQGASLRSYADIKMKGSFYFSGGFEYNYQQPFYSIGIVKNLNSWQQSGLAGVSKIVSMNTKFLKKTKLQLLWDFLSYQQIPKTQPFKFRVGYNF